MNSSRIALEAGALVLTGLAIAAFTSCGGNQSGMSLVKPALAVADSNNSRVLLYADPLSNGSTAEVGSGHRDFSSAAPNGRKGNPDATTLSSPSSVLTDAEGKIYVVDSGNSRVLIFDPPFTTGKAAGAVIGQSDFISGEPRNTADGMGSAYAIALDGKGNLWVADVSNGRVLEYQPPFRSGMEASVVIGQNSASAQTQNCYDGAPSASSVCYPAGLAFDSAGNLWISDANNNRVLRFSLPFSTGMSASLELGQPASTAFTSNASGAPARDSLNAPTGLVFDPMGNLWVSDLNNNRVLKFAPPFSNGMSASEVLGQSDFVHGTPNRGAGQPDGHSLFMPWGLAINGDGNLIVTDTYNNRILTFSLPLQTGSEATVVLGQSVLTDGAVNQGAGSDNPTGSTLFHPLSSSAF
jgi:sugar lactone lactonase YvrE